MERFENQNMPDMEAAHLSLEEQRHLPRILRIRGEKGELARRIPVLQLTPENPKEETPVVIVGGFTEGLETLGENAEHVARLNHNVITYGEPEEFPSSGTKDSTESALVERNAKDLLEVLSFSGVGAEKATVAAHSAGAIEAIIAAMKEPEKFRNLILISGGLKKKESFFTLLRKGINHHLWEKSAALLDQSFAKGIAQGKSEREKNLFSHPFDNVRYAWEIADIEIGEILKTLHDKGIGIAIVHSADDKVFPMENVQRVFREMKPDSGTSGLRHGETIDGFYSVRGGHNEFIARPEEYARLIDSIITDLERKKAKRTAKQSELESKHYSEAA